MQHVQSSTERCINGCYNNPHYISIALDWKCIDLYSQYINKNKIYIYIFGNRKILKKKLDILKKKINNKVIIDIDYENYK